MIAALLSRIGRLVFVFSLAVGSIAQAGSRGVIQDPDGFTNLRAKQSAEAAVVAQVKAGEIFEYQVPPGDFATWVKVKLASGKTGWMHASRVRMYATLDDLANTTPDDEVNVYGRGAKIDYYPLARSAARGDAKGMGLFFGINDMDGAAAETHAQVVGTVMHVLGDERLAKFLSGQKAGYLAKIREGLLDGMTTWPFEPKGYLQRNFPKSAKILGVK